MKHRKMAIILGIVFLLICAGLYIIIYTIPDITGSLTPTTIVEYGQMKISKTVSAVVVREETVFNSEQAGNVSYYVDNNTKTRKGIKILDIYGANNKTTSIECPQTGVVSFYYDGYESTITPETISSLADILPAEEQIKVSYLHNEKLSEGDFCYKLITSDTWYTVFFVSDEDLDLYRNISSVSLEFETGKVAARITNIIEHEEGSDALNIVVVSTAKYFADYDKLRQCNVKIVLKDDKGLIVPNTAITEEEGNTGVFVKKIDGEYKFTRVKVINSDEENSVVYADTFSVLREDGLTDTVQTISIYDEILKNAAEKDR